MAVSNLNGVLFTGISAIDGITRSTLSAINGQTITAGGSGFAEVGSGSQRASAFSTTAVATKDFVFPGDVTIGDLLIFGGGLYAGDGNPRFSSITSTRSADLSIILSSTIFTGRCRSFLAYAIATSSGACTITANLTSDGATAAYVSGAIDEFSNPNATPLDADGGSSTGTSTTPSDGVTSSVSNALVVGVTVPVSAVSITPDGGWTTIGEEDSNPDPVYFNLAFQIVGGAATYTPAWTFSGSSEWVAQAIAFKPV